ncbi:hypothetical protein [Marinobacter sp.]|uniref:hypothetical protein n=1 Tax=Marinobacter sp. TaxID=50741 RepID=UPI003B51AA56
MPADGRMGLSDQSKLGVVPDFAVLFLRDVYEQAEAVTPYPPEAITTSRQPQKEARPHEQPGSSESLERAFWRN